MWFSGGILSAGRSSAFSHSSLLAPKRESLDIAVTAGVLRETTKILVSGWEIFFKNVIWKKIIFSNFSLSEAGIPPNLEMSTLQMLLPEIDLAEVIGNFKPFLSEKQIKLFAIDIVCSLRQIWEPHQLHAPRASLWPHE